MTKNLDKPKNEREEFDNVFGSRDVIYQKLCIIFPPKTAQEITKAFDDARESIWHWHIESQKRLLNQIINITMQTNGDSITLVSLAEKIRVLIRSLENNEQ